MRPRNLLILLVLVLALGAFLWFVERDLPGSEARQELAGKVLPQLADAEVTAVTLQHGGETVRLVRLAAKAGNGEGEEGDATESTAPAEWQIAAPASLAGRRADRSSVDSLLSALSDLGKERDVEDAEPAAVGLDTPRARVTLLPAGGDAVTLAVGGDVPASSGMVVGVTTAPMAGETAAGETEAAETEAAGSAAPSYDHVYVVDRTIFTDLTRAPGDWRAKDLFPAGRGEVRRLSVEGEAGKVELARDADGAFRVVQPLNDRADRDAVDALLGILVGLRAQSFVDDPGARDGDLGLDPPRGTVVATLDDGSEVRVEVGAPVSGAMPAGGASPNGSAASNGGPVYLRVGDQVVTSTADLGVALERAPADWPSHRLTDLRLFEIDRVTVREPGTGSDGGEAGGEMVLERQGADWTRDGATISYTPVSDLLYTLTDAQADRVVPQAGLRLRAPDLTLVLSRDSEASEDDGHGEGDGAEPAGEEIRFHPAGAGEPVPVTVSGRDAVLLVAAPTVAQIRDHLATLRAAEPLPKEVDELPEGVDVDVEEGGGDTP